MTPARGNRDVRKILEYRNFRKFRKIQTQTEIRLPYEFSNFSRIFTNSTRDGCVGFSLQMKHIVVNVVVCVPLFLCNAMKKVGKTKTCRGPREGEPLPNHGWPRRMTGQPTFRKASPSATPPPIRAGFAREPRKTT